MRIVSMTAGAGGMFCGSCMRDNTLASALIALGHDALLVPTYTPITTDEPSVSGQTVFLGGVNVYLQEHAWLFRHAPRLLDALLNNNRLLRWAGKFVGRTDYSKMGRLTISMLQGKDGRQAKEVRKLVDWLKSEIKPEIVLMTNALLSGCVPAIADGLGVPVVTTLQGDDLFLDQLPEAERRRCIELIAANDRQTTAYLVTSRNYGEYMSRYLGIDPAKMHVVLPGLNTKSHAGPGTREPGRPPTLGYFARFAPEKGFHNLVEAYIRLRQTPGVPPIKLRYAGWLGDKYRPYLNEQIQRLNQSGFAADTEQIDCPDLASKVRFFQSIDLLSVPTAFREPKGLYVLEAWANGVPVVQPNFGSFPELIERTGGGLLYEQNQMAELVAALRELLMDLPQAAELGRKGYVGLMQSLTARQMAESTHDVLSRYLKPADQLTAAARN
jgi:glycosyltransferase involved in cell wall biosynthesis